MRASFDGRDLHVDEEAKNLLTAPGVRNRGEVFEVALQALLGFDEYERCKLEIQRFPAYKEPWQMVYWGAPFWGVRMVADLDRDGNRIPVKPR